MNNPQRRLPQPVTTGNSSTFVTIPQTGVAGGPSGGANAPQRQTPPAIDRVGTVLRQRREERGHDLQYIADSLYIRRAYLEALENSRYDALPADAYVIGFLRSYATYLQLDSRDVINLYRAEMAGRRKKPALTMPTPVTEGRTPSAIIMVAAAVIALLVYALWYGISSSDRASVSAPPTLPTAAATETTPSTTNGMTSGIALAVASSDITAKPAAVAAAPAPVASAAPELPVAPATPQAVVPAANINNKSAPPAIADSKPALPTAKQAAAKPAEATVPAAGLAIRAEQSSWVLVTDRDGNTIYDHVMKPGEVYNVPGDPDLFFTTGNAPGIVLSEDGVDLPRFSSRNATRVLRNVPLDSEHLRSRALGSNEE